MLKALLLVLAVTDTGVWAWLHATCLVRPNGNITPQLSGTITFEQKCPFSAVQVKVSVEGFTPNPGRSLHGLHVHAFGDISGGCGSTGPHYNPDMQVHGAKDAAVRHVGDFGNIEQIDGKVETSFKDHRAMLFGPYTIIGRAIVIHAGQDDLGLGGDSGSTASGNAGPRLACCVIGVAPGL